MAFTIKNDVITRIGTLPENFYCVYATDNPFPNISTKIYLLCPHDNSELVISEMSLSGNIKTQKNIQFSEITEVKIMDEWIFRKFSISLNNGASYTFWANKRVKLVLRNQRKKQDEYVHLITDQLKKSLNDKVIHKEVKIAATASAGIFAVIMVLASGFLGLMVGFVVFEKTDSNYILAILSGGVVFGVLEFALNRIIGSFYRKFSSQYKSDSENHS